MSKKSFFLIPLVVTGSLWLLLNSLHRGNQFLSASWMTTKSSPRDTLSRATLLSRFSQPPDAYGPIDCWWWEAARVTKDKITWQLEELKDKGVAGTWYYARWLYQEPLRSDPPYWSEKCRRKAFV